MKGFILAAGLGTRFRPHTEILPKPALPFLNIPLLYYSIYLAEKMHAEHVIVNTHHLPHKIEQLIENIPKPKFSLETSHEPEILGTAGCMGKVREQLKDDYFFALNADVAIVPSHEDLFDEMIDFHKFEEPIATLLVMEHPEAGKKYGAVWTDSENNVLGFGKEPPSGHPEAKPYHYIGVRLFSPEVLDYVETKPSDIFYDVLVQAIAKGETVKVFVDDSTFYDGGDLKEFLANTQTIFRTMEDSPFFKKMAKRFWPDFKERNQFMHGKGSETAPANVLTGDHVTIGENVTFKGANVLGCEVVIEDGCSIENSVIAEGVRICAGVQIKDELVLTDVGC